MPQIQMLQPGFSFGSQLGQQLGGGLGQGIAGGLQQMIEQKQKSRQLEGLSPFLKQVGIPEEGISQLISSGLDPRIVSDLVNHLGQQQQRQQAISEKAHAEKQEGLQKAKGHLGTLEELESLLPYTGSVLVPGKGFLGGQKGFKGLNILNQPLNRESSEKRNQFDTAALTLEGLLRDLATKGALPQKTFQVLLERLPSSDLSDRENIGRINALRGVLKRSIGEEAAESILKKPSAEKELSVGQSTSSLPDAASYPNAIFSKNGKRYASNGKSWKEVK
jgi:hypothetical protein